MDNNKDGDGVFTYANHDKFTGSWKSDMKHGVGTYVFCKTGATLKGSWLNDKRVNNFEVFFPTGEESGFTFHGTWDDDETVSNKNGSTSVLNAIVFIMFGLNHVDTTQIFNTHAFSSIGQGYRRRIFRVRGCKVHAEWLSRGKSIVRYKHCIQTKRHWPQ